MFFWRITVAAVTIKPLCQEGTTQKCRLRILLKQEVWDPILSCYKFTICYCNLKMWFFFYFSHFFVMLFFVTHSLEFQCWYYPVEYAVESWSHCTLNSYEVSCSWSCKTVPNHSSILHGWDEVFFKIRMQFQFCHIFFIIAIKYSSPRSTEHCSISLVYLPGGCWQKWGGWQFACWRTLFLIHPQEHYGSLLYIMCTRIDFR